MSPCSSSFFHHTSASKDVRHCLPAPVLPPSHHPPPSHLALRTESLLTAQSGISYPLPRRAIPNRDARLAESRPESHQHGEAPKCDWVTTVSLPTVSRADSTGRGVKAQRSRASSCGGSDIAAGRTIWARRKLRSCSFRLRSACCCSDRKGRNRCARLGKDKRSSQCLFRVCLSTYVIDRCRLEDSRDSLALKVLEISCNICNTKTKHLT